MTQRSVRLRLDEIKNELIRGDDPEPYLWPFYFKIDPETVGRALREAADFKRAFDEGIPAVAAKSHWAYPFRDLRSEELTAFDLTAALAWPKQDQDKAQTWYSAPNGAHGNIGQSPLCKGCTVPLPKNVGFAEFTIYESNAEQLNAIRSCGFVVAILEEDATPSNEQIKELYKDFSRSVRNEIRKSICWRARHTARQNADLPEYMMRPPGFAHDVPLSEFIKAGDRKSNGDRAKDIKNGLKEAFKNAPWYAVNFDDVIGAGYRRWDFAELQSSGRKSFDFGGHTDDVSLTIRGHVELV
jgi:hypothetical protein